MLTYKKGDATNPDFKADETCIIMHCCNNIGAWGAGFTHALDCKWPHVGAAYRSQPKSQLRLGHVQFVRADDNIVVANIIGQHGIISQRSATPPIRYTALGLGFDRVANYAKEIAATTNAAVTVACPRLGAGLAGGVWETIEGLIESNLCSYGIDVTVYDL